MLDIQAYIESGILEEYCLGLLPSQEEAMVLSLCNEYPKLQIELEAMQNALGQFAGAISLIPPASLEGQIWEAIANKTKEQTMSLSYLPLIDRYSDYKIWTKTIAHLLPANGKEDTLFHELKNVGGIQQYLVVADADVDEEVHVDEQERLLILNGECECYIGAHIVHLGPGGFVEIPLHIRHSIKLCTPRVTAILQRVAV